MIAKEERSAQVGWSVLIIVSALVCRMWGIQEIPQGAYVDEVLTMRNTLVLFHKPFEPFGQTPLFMEGWVETSNLYLMFNALIVWMFGVSYTTTKLFSIIPGVFTCLFFYRSCLRLFSRKVALLTGFLLVFSHWHIRLSRYGWDVSFLLMCVSLSVWFFLCSEKKGARYLYLAGVVCGLSLYSYLASRVSTLSFLSFFLLELVIYRDKAHVKHLAVFSLGAALTAFPLLIYALRFPDVVSTRVEEVSLLSQERPLLTFWENVWGHVLMFHVRGGVYARDNFPGLPMMDIVTGCCLAVGLIVLLKRFRQPMARLILILFGCSFLPGLLSVSQQGAPYVYRVAIILIPAVLIAGYALEMCSTRWNGSFFSLHATGVRGWISTFLIVLTVMMMNLYAYFGKEAVNISAMRQMGFEERVLGYELSRLEGPVFLLMPKVFTRLPDRPLPGETYFEYNRNINWGIDLTYRAILYYSGRYQASRTFDENFHHAEIYLLSSEEPFTPEKLPCTVLYHEEDLRWVERLQVENPQLRIEHSPLRKGQGLQVNMAHLTTEPN